MNKDVSLAVIVLAAGKGTRMNSSTPKLLQPVANTPLIHILFEQLDALVADRYVAVVNEDIPEVPEYLHKHFSNLDITFTYQGKPQGTAHAVQCGMEALKDFKGNVLILCGDSYIQDDAVLEYFTNIAMEDYETDLTIAAFETSPPNSYGRLIINEDDELEAILEASEADEYELLANPLCNSGVMVASAPMLRKLLPLINNDNAKQEYYLTDLVELAAAHNYKCDFEIVGDEMTFYGVNHYIDLQYVEKLHQIKLRRLCMEAGIHLIDPDSVHLSHDTIISGNNVTIHPFVVFGPNVEISNNVEIKSFSHIEDAKIEQGAIVGPYARLRPGTIIEENAHIGNFVEIKNSTIGTDSKVNHLSYIGDSQIGNNTNIGAGTITCNYDGISKHQTIIGDECFIGSNSIFIAPVTLGDNVLTAAGSVITENVEDNKMAIARARQEAKARK